MCDPVSISLALTAAGATAQAAAQSQSRKAMEGAQQAERIRQKGFQDQSQAAFDESLGHAQASNQTADQSNAEASRKASYDKATADARAPVEATGQNLAGDASTNKVVNTEQAAQAAKAQGYAGQQGAAKAALQGFGDTQLGNALYNARQMQSQGVIGNAMQGSSAVLPFEVQAASHKGDGLKTLGDVLSLGGAVAGLGAGAGWWGGADKAAEAAGTLGTAEANAANTAMTGANSADLALGRSASAFGSNLGSQYANAFNLAPNAVAQSSFFPVGSVLSNLPLNAYASYGKYVPGLTSTLSR